MTTYTSDIEHDWGKQIEDNTRKDGTWIESMPNRISVDANGALRVGKMGKIG